MTFSNTRELRFARLSLSLTLLCLGGIVHFLFQNGIIAWRHQDTRLFIETAMFGGAILLMAYSNLLYQICLIGHYTRKRKHRPASRAEIEALYDYDAPTLSVIIPAYKEERSVVWQTMLSAALSEYPQKNVVLLIDDPHRPALLEDKRKLENTRRLPAELQALFDEARAGHESELAAFETRMTSGGILVNAELNRLATRYDNVALWLEMMAERSMFGLSYGQLNFADRFFIDRIIAAPAAQHRAFADKLRRKLTLEIAPSTQYLHRHYKRLVGLHAVNFSSFERKKYVNLSHEANKAMNLNSYIGLIGKSWREVETPHGLALHECEPEAATFTIPHADYVDTIDADSLMLSDYAIRLIHFMEQPQHARIAVAQSPCSSIPGSPNLLERIAGACIDVQFLTHQGYTHWGASFWVGANAMLRRTALEDIRETRMENGHVVSIYIQDRTVIEDTESTIDLVHKGWKLYNYPERMTYSATPPDFGSLLIQRRRWSNGGVIILPKLLHYFWHAKKNKALAREMFMRFHYLASTTTGVMVALVILLYPFGTHFSTPFVPLFVLPLLALYARDLKNAGYRYSDVWRVCAFNIMLFPIALGGVLKQFQQIITGEKIAFGRTPKVPGRTSAPALYCLAGLLMPIAFIGMAAHGLQQERYVSAGFSLLNSAFLTYALVYLMGLRATLQDIAGGASAQISHLRARERSFSPQHAASGPLAISA